MSSYEIDETHDPALRSWVESAEDPATDFPIQNLPLGVFRREPGPGRIGAAIGDQILDLQACDREGLLRGLPLEVEQAVRQPTLNAFMALPQRLRRALRHRLGHVLRAEGGQVTGRPRADLVLVPQSQAELLLPAEIGDYTDFYASVFHATNVGGMFRPDNPLLPNYKWLPIGYHGRASSIVASGTPVQRPSGQTEPASPDAAPGFGPSRLLDYELELGLLRRPRQRARRGPSRWPRPSSTCSACASSTTGPRATCRSGSTSRSGPFLAKNFATSISPWVVTDEALAPFRAPAFARPEGDPRPLPYLTHDEDQARGAYDVVVEVYLSSARMRAAGQSPVRLSRGNSRDLYWTPAQMLAHHARTAATCARATCWPAARSRAPRRARAAACSS